MGHPIGVIDSEQRLETKVNRLAAILEVKPFHALDYESKQHFTQHRVNDLKGYPWPDHKNKEATCSDPNLPLDLTPCLHRIARLFFFFDLVNRLKYFGHHPVYFHFNGFT